MNICGVISNSGPNGEPLGCGYQEGHEGPHAWSTLPTWPVVELKQETDRQYHFDGTEGDEVWTDRPEEKAKP